MGSRDSPMKITERKKKLWMRIACMWSRWWPSSWLICVVDPFFWGLYSGWIFSTAGVEPSDCPLPRVLVILSLVFWELEKRHKWRIHIIHSTSPHRWNLSFYRLWWEGNGNQNCMYMYTSISATLGCVMCTSTRGCSNKQVRKFE